MRLRRLLAFLSGVSMALGALPPVGAQVGGEWSKPVGEGSGPVSELSVPFGPGSRPVHERGRTVREGSGGPVISGPVRDPGTRSMKSGPVSELSRGPVSEGRAMSGSGSIGWFSAEAVKKDLASPIGEHISNPLTELAPLQDILRQRAMAPPVDAVAELPALAADGAPSHEAAEAEARFVEEPIELPEEHSEEE
jgi:hypothetical protein